MATERVGPLALGPEHEESSAELYDDITDNKRQQQGRTMRTSLVREDTMPRAMESVERDNRGLSSSRKLRPGNHRGEADNMRMDTYYIRMDEQSLKTTLLRELRVV
eukprot:CAMPEP_0117085374 /NCGR_PEP_ID=MMETSP0472-20121206/60027_1 /TAXON_ID=693140 ORGANISM="Tiarina fusus, Strain LIS" /NCGR_SAMPLE_ID=MMETSP0472 /ASSEMBLY_ACC=CAM_ASM_000603 /LENGTH=105 /DNA_ID=CAMNT_0004814625 /DNA_START=91 /DNA_END=409 /DNA_ORIENTATION=+